MRSLRLTYLPIQALVEALCEALVLTDSDALVEALIEGRGTLQDSLALVEALIDAGSAGTR